jgi:hypothetical protein
MSGSKRPPGSDRDRAPGHAGTVRSWSTRVLAVLCGVVLPAGLAGMPAHAAAPVPSAAGASATPVRSPGVAALAGLSFAPTALASKRSAVKITASALPHRATVGQASTIAGTVTAASAKRLHVQRRAAGSSSWHTVRTIVPDHLGRYVFAWTPTSRSTQQFRVLQPAHGRWKAAVSPTITVRVAAAAPSMVVHSVSLGFEDVVIDDGAAATWDVLRGRLDASHVNLVQLAAGRVEWTAFDWAAHPTAAADPGTDHLGAAIRALTPRPDGSRRQVALTIDALVPAMIAADPRLAGRSSDGRTSTYLPSATALHDGAVGDRLVAFARDLAVRYRPDQIAITELVFGDETFGTDDLSLYRRMTGARDWPRTPGGAIATDAAAIGTWRAAVIYDLLARIRRALDQVTPQVGHRVELAQDVRVNWAQPTAGRPESGADYRVLSQAADQLVLWAYFGTQGRTAADVGRLATALGAGRFTISIGMWSGADETDVLTAAQLAGALSAAHQAHALNVTPQSLLSANDWQAIAAAWTSWPG